MCRLFGMSAGAVPAQVTFWLLDAPDSLVTQSHRNVDGVGIGYFDAAGTAHVDKQPIAAYEDRRFASAAREIRSRTFVSHVRHATAGGLTRANTHPFCEAGRLFAHNGVIGDIAALERHLGDDLSRVGGQTDSERYFALITKEIERHNGDIAAGIGGAVEWIESNLPIQSINFVLTTATELWAFRYPEFHSLFVLERPAGGAGSGAPRELRQTSGHGTRVHSAQARERPVVVVASEQLDADAWREIPAGQLLRVDAELTLTTEQLLSGRPSHQL